MKKAYGFTIIELLVVVFIIGIITAVTIVSYSSVTNKAKGTQVTAALKDISNYLASDYMTNETYPSSIDSIINTANGVKVKDNISTEYSYDSSNNSYCLTAHAEGVDSFAHYVTNDDTSPKSGGCTGHRLTDNLVENGLGEKGSNVGFTNFDFTSADSPPDASGSLVAKTGSYVFYCGSQKIPINVNNKYKISGWARQTVSAVTTATWYFGLCPYDADGLLIGPSNYLFRPGTTTTLAQPLKTGDTIVRLTNVSSSWYNTNDTNTHRRSFIFWGYTDGKGKLWPPETYSRNPWYSNMWDGGSTNVNTTNNTITLNKPWPGGNYPAGHPVSNGSAGSTYMYSAAAASLTPATWKKWTSGNITGTVTGLTSAGSSFPISAESASVLIGINASSPPATSRQAVGGIDFYQVQ